MDEHAATIDAPATGPDAISPLGDCVAVVTGSSTGIGRAVAHRLGEMGAVVAGLDVDDPAPDSRLDAARLHLRCDVTDEREVEEAFAGLQAQLGPVTVLVNNAGVTQGFDPVEMTAPEWDAFFAVDLRSAWLCSRAALRTMRERCRGAIVNVASIHATLTQPGVFPYAVAKAASSGSRAASRSRWPRPAFASTPSRRGSWRRRRCVGSSSVTPRATLGPPRCRWAVRRTRSRSPTSSPSSRATAPATSPAPASQSTAALGRC